MDHPYGKQYGQEGNPRAYMTMRDYRNLPYQWGNQQPVERNPSEYMSMRDYRNLELQNQQPVGRNPNLNMSLREYRDKWMSAPVYHVPSTYPPPPQYDYPEPPFYASPPQSPQSPQPLQSIHQLEQAMLDLNQIMDDFVEANKKIKAHSIVTVEDNLNERLDGLNIDFEHKRDNLQDSSEDLIDQQQCPPEEECQRDTRVEEQRVVTVQANQQTETVESSLNKELDGFQGESDQKLDIQQESILKLTNQFVHQEQKNLEEESQEDECLTETIFVEQAQLQPQEELKMESVEAPEELQEAPVNFWSWTKEEEITALLTEKSSGHEGTQEPIIQPNPQAIPIDLDQNATAQPKNNPLLVPPSADLVYIQPQPAANSKPAAPAPKGKSNPLPAAPPESVFILPTPAAQPKPQASTTKAIPSMLVLQNIRRLVASVHAFATTSKKMANAYIAWHSGWFWCGFGFGAPGPRHF